MLNRRHLVLAAALGLPFAARATDTPDVAVIGAGIAGISAARTLLAAGRTVTVLEALDRTGGRAFTDRALDGMIFDQGAAYLESATRNPLAAEAKRLGLATSPFDPDEWAYEDDARTTPEAQRAYSAAGERLQSILDNSSAASGAEALKQFLRTEPWAHSAIMSGVTTDDGVDPEDLCLADWRGREGGYPYWAVAGGIGALVQRLALELPISRSTPVTHVREAADGYAIETSRGSIRSKAVIVTVSPAVLASGAIKFSPGLPPEIVSAAANLQMGHLEKVAFSVIGETALPREEFTLVPKIEDDRNYYLHMRPHGQPMIVHYAGGRYAKQLVSARGEVAIDAARQALARHFGSQILKRIKGARATRWGQDPQFLGAYAAAHPSKCTARETLSRPFSENMILAGEALAGLRHQSLDGAWNSGANAARSVVKALK